MRGAAERFPVKTPETKEAYWFRTIFEEHFKNPSAVDLVPDGPSIACSTPTAIRWDSAWAALADPLGPRRRRRARSRAVGKGSREGRAR